MKTQHFKLSLIVVLFVMMMGTSCKKENNVPKPFGTIYTHPVRFVTINNKGVFDADCAVHWGANGTSSSVHKLMQGMGYTWDLSSANIPDQWRFWASIDVFLGKYIDSNKDRYYYDPSSTAAVVYTLTGSIFNPKISSTYSAQ